jgi:hypothetical protein
MRLNSDSKINQYQRISPMGRTAKKYAKSLIARNASSMDDEANKLWATPPQPFASCSYA